MTKEELAIKLHGRHIGKEVTEQLEAAAKESGLVIVFGASDDLMEFRGAIDDEMGAYDGGEAFIVDGELWEGIDCDHRGEGCKYAKAAEAKALEHGKRIEALWCEENPYSWTFKTDIPHATFEIFEGDEKFCRGIVFSLADVA